MGRVVRNRQLDDGLALALARGPDELYLKAVGAQAPVRDPEVEAMADNAGLEPSPTKAELAKEVVEAKAQFEPRVREATAKMRARADERLVAACKTLEAKQAACIADFPALSTQMREEQASGCDADDAPCNTKIQDRWAKKHPQCAWLSDWIDWILEG